MGRAAIMFSENIYSHGNNLSAITAVIVALLVFLPTMGKIYRKL